MNSSKQEPRSLIMCTSPLQILIAERIVELNSNKKFDLLVMASNENNKFRYYYNRLESKCFNSLYHVTETGLKGFFKFVVQLKANGLNRDYQDLYMASIDLRDFHYLYSKNKRSNIFTFDDGVANITPNGLYYSKTKPVIFKRVVWWTLGIRYYIEDMRKLSLLHYTIYKDIPNIINNTQFIDLYKNESADNTKINKIVKIQVGQPIQNLSNLFDNSYIVDVMKILNIEYYYPHPKETVIPTGEFKVIESSLIFEDYIVDFLKKNLDTEVEIYSFFSGALLNISGLNRVNLKYIYNSLLYDNYRYFYDLAEVVFQIDCINLDA